MRIGLGLVACVCVCLLISSVTAAPAVAGFSGVGVEGYTDTFTAGLAGRTIGLESFSNSTEFRAGDVRGIDIQIGDMGRGQRGDGSAVETIRDGIFTITHGERGSRVSRSGLDERGIVLVEGLQAAGFAFDGAVTDPYETTISCGAVPAVDPKVLSSSGLRRSTDTTSVLVGSGRVTTYKFTNTSTGRPFELTVTQPTDEHGQAVGNAMVSTPTSGGSAGRSVRNDPSDIEIAVIVGGGTGAVAGVGVTLGLLGGAATVTEATALLGTTGAVCCGLSATGVGVVVAVVVAVGVGAVVTYWLFTHHGGDSLAPAVMTTGTSPPYYVSLSDGAVVRDDGTVAFFVRDQPESMSLTGTDWVSATRKSAINRAGELSILTPKKPEGPVWFKERSARRYIAVSQTGSWVAAISIDADGKTYLEIPMGHGQPSTDSPIRKDLASLNAGKNPHHHHMFKDVTIDPPVTGWKAFVPGDDYGLALADDGRVFCVGTTKDNLGDLHGRYTKVTTGVRKGYVENDRYAIGIRIDDGGLDFAGDDPNHINDDIKKAHLDHVIDIAAGPDRALALTSHGQLVVLGEEHGWDPVNTLPPPTDDRSYSAVSASVLPSNKCIFVLGEEPGQHVHITGKLVPGQPLPLAPESRVSRDLAMLQLGSTMTYFAAGTRIESATGKSLWTADTEIDRLHLPGKSVAIPATHVVEAPCSSIILDESIPDTTRVHDATTHQLLITLHYHSARDLHRHTASPPTAAPARTRGTEPIIQDLQRSPSWVVWAANHYTSTDSTEFGSYEAEWTVPDKPKVVETNLNNYNKHTESCCYSSVQTYTQDGKSGGIFQPVLAYNWAQRFGQQEGQEDYNPGWSAWIYDLTSEKKKDDHAISPARITDIQPGDKIRAVITYDGNEWTASLTRTRPNTPPQTVSLTRQHASLSAKNVDTEVVYEAYLRPQLLDIKTMIMQTHEDKYFMGNIKFDPIVMKDRNGKVIPNEFHAYANKAWWDHKSECPNIGVDITSIPNPLTGGSLWYVIDLKTVG